MTVDAAALREAVSLLAGNANPAVAELAEMLPKLFHPGRDRVKPWQYAEVFEQARANNPSPKTHCYMRKSTEGELRQQFTLAAQVKAQNDAIKARGLPEGIPYIDEASAAKYPLVEREEGYKLIRNAKPGDYIQITHWDRAFRQLVDGLHWIRQWCQNGIRLVVLDFEGMGFDFGTPIGEFIATLLGAVAQLESRMNGDRQRAVAPVRRARGHRMTNKPSPGYVFRKRHIGGKMTCFVVPHEEERKTVAMIQDMRERGSTVYQIFCHLRKNGIRRVDTHKEWTQRMINLCLGVDFEAMDAKLGITAEMSEWAIAQQRCQWATAGAPDRSDAGPPST